MLVKNITQLILPATPEQQPIPKHYIQVILPIFLIPCILTKLPVAMLEHLPMLPTFGGHAHKKYHQPCLPKEMRTFGSHRLLANLEQKDQPQSFSQERRQISIKE